MKYKLINPVNSDYSAIEQVLTNRGIPHEEIRHYLNTSDADINPPEALGQERMEAAAALLVKNIKENNNVKIIIDADCDGFTSSALLLNYLYKLFPSWITDHVTWFMHDGKQHGLNDCIDQIINSEVCPSLVILPDAGTNDVNECKRLNELNIGVIVLDHHDKEVDNPYAIIINNQIGDYPNKELSGVGVTWQFCRYLDKLLEVNNADYFIDLVALGDIADMMSLKSIETKHLIDKGLHNVHNPFIVYLADKNDYSLKGKLNFMGVAFYIAPFVNAIVRSGTQEEKDLVFLSMLSFHAFDEILSNKRGHAPGEKETIVMQTMRTVTNVKARQTKIQNECMDKIEQMIIDRDLLKHKVLLFLLEPGEVDKNVAGLVANKIMAKYQRPVCILTKTKISQTCLEEPEKDRFFPITVYDIIYQGSSRGCDKVDVNDFKSICAATNVVEYTIGHPGAFGVGIKEENIDKFIEETDKLLTWMPDEAVYYVDYIFDANNINENFVLEIGMLDDLWGREVDEPLIAVKNIRVTPDMVTIYDKRSLTIKIALANGISLMLFNAKEEDCKQLQENNTGYVEIEIVGKCNCNEWNDMVTPQIFIEEYQIVDSNKFYF